MSMRCPLKLSVCFIANTGQRGDASCQSLYSTLLLSNCELFVELSFQRAVSRGVKDRKQDYVISEDLVDIRKHELC